MSAGCGGCAAKAAARAARQQKATKDSGPWSLTMMDGTRTFHDTRLAALAANVQAGGGGMVRRAG